ncbi:MAG: MSMEG_6728 family protein [Deltaproteobacteria bacterium]
MQTFLPYPDFKKSLQAIDYRRLGKQRVEAYQIIRAIKYGDGWQHHPAVKMWRGHINALKLYYNLSLDEWIGRGYRNNMQKMPIRGRIAYPQWFGRNCFHAAHRSNLLRKDPHFYGQYKWSEPPDLPYLWG